MRLWIRNGALVAVQVNRGGQDGAGVGTTTGHHFSPLRQPVPGVQFLRTAQFCRVSTKRNFFKSRKIADMRTNEAELDDEYH